MLPNKRTKIIATIGPVTASDEMIIKLYENGINIIRFNFSHADYESAHDIASRIHRLNEQKKTSLSLLLDTKGPELRTGDLKEKKQYKKGDIFRIYSTINGGLSQKQEIQGGKDFSTGVYIDINEGEKSTSDNEVRSFSESLTCDYPYLAEDVEIGGIIEIDSGLFHVRVISKGADFIEVIAENDALIGSRRHVNLPGVKIRLPGITDKDKEDILFGIKNNYHFIAASFIRTAENVREIREFLDTNGGKEIRIISKIENAEGIENLESIVKVSDGVMVARGDLGIEVPIEKVPKYQKKIIDLCRESGKFVIVATHMLESMIEHPFPTRAEVSDIFRAVLHGADSTMLSGETTTGKYPIESVSMMTNVICEAEEELEHKHHEYSDEGLSERDIEKKALIRSAIEITEKLGLEAVVLFTKSGRLARIAAAYRPNTPVVAFTGNEKSLGFMRILYGIESCVLDTWGAHEENLKNAIQYLMKTGKLSESSRIVAITDILENGNEIPAMEIISIRDIL